MPTRKSWRSLIELTELAHRVAIGYGAYEPHLPALEALNLRPREDAATLARLHDEGLHAQVDADSLGTLYEEEYRVALVDAADALAWCRMVRSHLTLATLYPVDGTTEAVREIRGMLRRFSQPRFPSALATVQLITVHLAANRRLLENHPSGALIREMGEALRERLEARASTLALQKEQHAAAKRAAEAIHKEIRSVLLRARNGWEVAHLANPTTHPAWPWGEIDP